jgi:plasmid stabilization system protein ParE
VSPRVYRLVIRPEADEEVREAALWYESRERGLGHEFLRAFRAATAVLRRNPLLYQVVVEQARRVLLRRFPYCVFYEVHGSEVVILACLRESRDPEEWERRITRP